MKNENMQIRCLTGSTVTDIKPPLTLLAIYVATNSGYVNKEWV